MGFCLAISHIIPSASFEKHLIYISMAGLVSMGLGNDPFPSSAKEDQEGSEKSLRMPPSFILLLARVVEAMESKSVIQVLELLAALFAGQGAAAGSEQPPAFVAGEVARSA